jgi:uncharacterized protein
MFLASRIIFVILLLALTELYFYKKLKKSVIPIFPSVPVKKFRLYVFIAYGLINIYPLYLLGIWLYINIYNSGRLQLPENILLDIITFTFWTGTLIMIQSILFFILIDIPRLMLYPLYKKNKLKILPWEAKILLFLIAFFTLYIPVRIVYDYEAVSVRPVELIKNNLPAQLKNFRLVFISDIQADRYTNRGRLQNYMDKVNALKPDLVLIAGDLITGSPDYINLSAEYVGRIKSKYGVFSCVGDHDNWAYREDTKRSIREVTAALAKYKVKMIDNGEQSINVNGAEIKITFITNTYVESVSPGILNGLTEKNNTKGLKIFLTHQPRQNLITAAKQHHYDLLLAGHTHGGQITLLFPFYSLSPTLFETRYVKGTFNFGSMMMIVTRGLGMSLAPLRLNSTPEITVINVSGK